MSREDTLIAKKLIPNLMKKEVQPTEYSISSNTTSSLSTLTLTERLMTMVGMTTTRAPLARLLTVEDELTLFIQSIQLFKGNFSSFWTAHRHRFTRLYRVAQRINIVPATSVASESIFSIAGFVTRKQRSSLTSTSLRYLVVLKESHRLDGLRPKRSIGVN